MTCDLDPTPPAAVHPRTTFGLRPAVGERTVTYLVLGDFAANAVGLTLATLLAARLAGRVPTRVVITLGLLATGLVGVLLLAGALWFDTPLLVSVFAFFLLMSTQGFTGPNAGARVRRRA